MDTKYVKLTWTEISLNQLGECHKFEVFAQMKDKNIISAHYSDGEKLKNPKLTFEEGFNHLYFDATNCSGNKERMVEIVHIEEIKKEEFEAASSNKENMQSLKF